MNKEAAEQIICNWLSRLKNKKASHISLAEIRKLVEELILTEVKKL